MYSETLSIFLAILGLLRSKCQGVFVRSGHDQKDTPHILVHTYVRPDFSLTGPDPANSTLGMNISSALDPCEDAT
jgi:hypothetical protein